MFEHSLRTPYWTIGKRADMARYDDLILDSLVLLFVGRIVHIGD
jgi:hypothetical protein